MTTLKKFAYRNNFEHFLIFIIRIIDHRCFSFSGMSKLIKLAVWLETESHFLSLFLFLRRFGPFEGHGLPVAGFSRQFDLKT